MYLDPWKDLDHLSIPGNLLIPHYSRPGGKSLLLVHPSTHSTWASDQSGTCHVDTAPEIDLLGSAFPADHDRLLLICTISGGWLDQPSLCTGPQNLTPQSAETTGLLLHTAPGSGQPACLGLACI